MRRGAMVALLLFVGSACSAGDYDSIATPTTTPDRECAAAGPPLPATLPRISGGQLLFYCPPGPQTLEGGQRGTYEHWSFWGDSREITGLENFTEQLAVRGFAVRMTRVTSSPFSEAFLGHGLAGDYGWVSGGPPDSISRSLLPDDIESFGMYYDVSIARPRDGEAICSGALPPLPDGVQLPEDFLPFESCQPHGSQTST